MNSSNATVVHGSRIWTERTGPVLLEEGEDVVVLLEGQDDGGPEKYPVRMPRSFVKFGETPAAEAGK